MHTHQRKSIALINAFFITTCLLYFMYYLVRMDEPTLLIERILPPIVLTPPPEDTDLKINIPMPPAPPKVVPAPVLDKEPPTLILQPIKGALITANFERRSAGKLPVLYNSQLVLALNYPPTYPSSAIARGVEGYAIVGFSVGASGAVYDPFIIESKPNELFDRSSLKAILKFKYKARVVDGYPVSTDGQRYLFTYTIDSE